ncbi:hypothetical protein EHS25_000497 [Saitozyma podzolica]|uniref:DH domain-containing protein n=1 Tax=Saitozyma podzolica TaxID=1890683 RepID=A0A427YWA6_9TREE|nr:hypothetical protein EHS25_000497 [Saitozyma podzolica]
MPTLSFSPQKSRLLSTSLGPISGGGPTSAPLAGPAYSPYGMGKGAGLGAAVGSLATTSTSTSPALPPPLPPKMIDLNSSTRSTDRESEKKITRRAFLCDVVVEREGEETNALLAQFGQPLSPLSTLPAPLSTTSNPTTPSRSRSVAAEDDDGREAAHEAWAPNKREEMAKRLSNLIEELVRTERSYLQRIKVLKQCYADPLRAFAKDQNTQIIPLYEAKNLFANIDLIVPASHAFLADLEAMWASEQGEATVGDVCLRHFKDLRTFDPYRTYLSKQDEGQKMFQDVTKKFSGFSSFIDSTKYQTTGIGNIGLRELLMEPVQRIPRYTLLWQTMLKCMPPLSPQRAKLFEAIEIASRIAKCEPDAQTVRATVLYCLERNVEGFPAKLFSNKRDFIDSIDVEDLPSEYHLSASPNSRGMSYSSRPSTFSATSTSTPSLASIGSSAASSYAPVSPPPTAHVGIPALHCTLFLFDDKLMIVKRQSSSISGRKVTGLDDVQRLVKTGGGIAVLDKNGAKKDKLSYRGVVDVLDVIASDVGNGDFHLFFERPPMDQSDRWAARPFRSYTTVHPPYSVSLDPVATRRDKLRFVHNLWAAQALARAKLLPQEVRQVPRALVEEEEIGLESAGEMFGRAKCYWNVWERQGWLHADRKAKVVVHVDEDGEAEDLAPKQDGGPCMVIRLQPMSGGLCRYSFISTADDEPERTVIPTSEVNERIVTTIHQYGVFKFRTSTNSAPNTPSATHRLRPSMINLDAISRNLFGTGSVSGRSHQSGSSMDMFSSTSSKRKPVPASRSSTMETNRLSYMSVSSEEMSRKRLSAMSAMSGSSAMSISSDERKVPPRSSTSPSSVMSDEEDYVAVSESPYKASAPSDLRQSDVDLHERLQLARKNSKSMAALLPGGPGASRLGTRSVAELRGNVENRERESRLGAKSVPDLKRDEKQQQAEDSLRAALRAGSPAPLPATAPLRLRSKTPSPTKGLRTTGDDTPRPPDTGSDAAPAAPLTVRKTPTLDAETLVASPRQIVSGNGRRVSVGRETIPLKGGDEENENENDNAHDPSKTPTVYLTAKRQHSEDHLQPRKRSLSRSPLEPMTNEITQIMEDPPRVPSFSKPAGGSPSSRIISGNRRSSGTRTPRRVSGQQQQITPRKVSTASVKSVASVSSQATATSVVTVATVEDVIMVEHPDAHTAIEAAKHKIAESRASAKRLKSEVVALRKQLSKDVKPRTPGLDRNASLPRSPQKRHMNRLLDLEGALGVESAPGTPGHSKRELDGMIVDDCARGIASVVDKLDAQLKAAQADNEAASVLVMRVAEENQQNSAKVEMLNAQVGRAKEGQELLRQQLSDVQIELDTIYEAFNVELDGMFNDANLPPTEAFEAMKRDLKDAKAGRNELALENKRLKMELEEASLKREQWAKILREQGIIP